MTKIFYFKFKALEYENYLKKLRTKLDENLWKIKKIYDKNIRDAADIKLKALNERKHKDEMDRKNSFQMMKQVSYSRMGHSGEKPLMTRRASIGEIAVEAHGSLPKHAFLGSHGKSKR